MAVYFKRTNDRTWTRKVIEERPKRKKRISYRTNWRSTYNGWMVSLLKIIFGKDTIVFNYRSCYCFSPTKMVKPRKSRIEITFIKHTSNFRYSLEFRLNLETIILKADPASRDKVSIQIHIAPPRQIFENSYAIYGSVLKITRHQTTHDLNTEHLCS